MQLWDVKSIDNPNLGCIRDDIPRYVGDDYLADARGLEILGGVHVETIQGQMPGGCKLDALAETEFIVRESKKMPFPVQIVPFVDLSTGSAAVENCIRQHQTLAGSRIVGVRMVLSYDDKRPELCWPQVPHGRHLCEPSEAFKDG